MSDGSDELARLRRLLGEGEGGGATTPDAGRIWRAAAGELPPEAFRETLDAALDSPEAARDWALAVAIREAAARAGDPGAVERPARFLGPGRLLLAAAVLLAAVALPVLLRTHRPAGPVLRGGEAGPGAGVAVRETVLPRDRFRLAWRPGPEGATYDLLVADADLRPLYEAKGLTVPEAVVPAAKLADLPDGATVLWQVTVHRPDGTADRSPTHVVRVGPPAGGESSGEGGNDPGAAGQRHSPSTASEAQ